MARPMPLLAAVFDEGLRIVDASVDQLRLFTGMTARGLYRNKQKQGEHNDVNSAAHNPGQQYDGRQSRFVATTRQVERLNNRP